MSYAGHVWVRFAAVLLVLAGAFNVIDGLRALTNASQIESHFPDGKVQLPLTNDLKVWGWVVLIAGVFMLLAGFLAGSGNLFGRLAGVSMAGLNAIIQLGFMDHNPIWSFTIILFDAIIIYALVVHGGRGNIDSGTALD